MSDALRIILARDLKEYAERMYRSEALADEWERFAALARLDGWESRATQDEIQARRFRDDAAAVESAYADVVVMAKKYAPDLLAA